MNSSCCRSREGRQSAGAFELSIFRGCNAGSWHRLPPHLWRSGKALHYGIHVRRIAVFDYDNDGWTDILLVNGSTLEDLRAGKCRPSKLYPNNRDGTFTDVPEKLNIDPKTPTTGSASCGWITTWAVASISTSPTTRPPACCITVTAREASPK
jgi:FG-GAP-like repeat